MENKKWYQKTWFKILIAVIVLSAIGKLLSLNNKGEKANSLKPEEVKKPSLTMAEVKASRYIKEALKDPDSYQKINVSSGFLKEYKKDTTAHKYIQVKIQYRAKNSFGGYVVNQQCVILNTEYTPLEIFECK